MTMYEYVAMSNPRTMGANLRMLVSQEGESALKSIAQMHPDRELILEACGVNKRESFMGVDGLINGTTQNNNQNQQEANDSTKLAYQTNAMMIVVALIIASAIIVNQKK